MFLHWSDAMNMSWIDEYINGVTEYCCFRDIFEIYDTLNIKT
jgi:hypothetical protein